MQQVEHMLNEKNILAMLTHTFIVKLGATFHDERNLYMALEYVVGGEFFSHLRRAVRFEDQVGQFYAAHVVLIFMYIHSQDIIYRDLKPENLLLDSDGFLKITDFGYAKVVNFKTYTLCGTPEYIAPEVLLNKGHGKGVDWWTLGILVYEMVVGQPPFLHDDPLRVYQQVGEMSEGEALLLIRLCTTRSPTLYLFQVLAGKIAFPRLVEKNTKNLIKKLLNPDLTKRYGCLRNEGADVKEHKWFVGFDFDALLERKIQPPIVPQVEGNGDTSQFDAYPDSDGEAEMPDLGDGDPFVDF
ncbi:unnamed protein product [Chrysoparadoxa australica]